MNRLPDVIETQRLRLRRATPADAEELFALFNNWNVIRWLARPQWPASFEGMEAFLETVNRDLRGPQYWVIERDHLALGGISARIQPASDHQSGEGPHIGYWLGEPYWGQGVMSEAAERLVGAIFAAMPAPAIYSGVFEGNHGSLRIQQKLGFAIESRAMMFSNPMGKEIPHVGTILTRAAFEARREN